MLAARRLPLVARTLTQRSNMSTSTSVRASVAPTWQEWRTNPPSATPKDSVMSKNQPDLPRLPVPKLEQTIRKVLRHASAVAKDDKEFAELQKKAEDFAKKGGLGEELQKRLEARRETPGLRSWIIEWWDKAAYMAYRDSIVINVSYYFGFNRLPQGPAAKNGSDPAYVAASLSNTALTFRRLVTQGLLEPEAAGKEGGELCMETFKWLFNACRVPAPGEDYATKVLETSEEAQHIIAIRKNRFWKLPVKDQAGKPLSIDEFKKLFDQIYAADSKGTAPAVGVLTGINRDTWAGVYADLSDSSPKNAQILADIRNSAFVVSLDEADAATKTDADIQDFSAKIWHSGPQVGKREGSNRWWDKPLQWVVFQNGECGFIGEHSCMDATPTARMNDFMTRLLMDVKEPQAASGPAASAPVALEFELNDSLKKSVADAEKEFDAHVSQYDLFYKRFTRYGKNAIKKAKTSPDAWVQMMFQLSYYMTHNKFCGTYEAAQTRKYQFGRTETIRSCSPESAAWVKSMFDSNVSRDERRRLLGEATKQQSSDVRDAGVAQGVDRHIFGWKHLLKDGESHPFLTDALLKYSSEWRMSTSQIYIKYAPAYGWGPVIGDGFGLPYLLQDDLLQFTITTHKSNPGAEFTKNLEKAGNLMMDLFERESKA